MTHKRNAKVYQCEGYSAKRKRLVQSLIRLSFPDDTNEEAKNDTVENILTILLGWAWEFTVPLKRVRNNTISRLMLWREVVAVSKDTKYLYLFKQQYRNAYIELYRGVK